MDKASADRLAKVHPELKARVERTINGLAAKGFDVRVVQGLRTYAEQDALYAQGRTRKGAIVTKARGGSSNHNFGLAVDCCPFKSGKPDWNDGKAFNAIGVEGKKNKLNWGGDWKFVDKPHLELPTGMTTKACRELYGKGGLASVWKQASAKLGVSFSAATDQPTRSGPSTGNKSAITAASETATESTEGAADIVPAEQTQSVIKQEADQIINTGDSSNIPPPEDKTLKAPEKDGATATSTKMTIAGIVVPGFLVAMIQGLKQLINDGFVSAADIGSTVLTFIRENQKYVFLLIGLLIVLLIVKKVIKIITFWIEMITHAVPGWNNIHVTADKTGPPPSPWYVFWR